CKNSRPSGGVSGRFRVREIRSLLVIGLLSVASLSGGCKNTPPPRVPVPSSSGGNPYGTYEHDPVKPLPPSATQDLRESGNLREVARPADGMTPSGLMPI